MSNNDKEATIYKHSAEEAFKRGEIDKFHQSRDLDIECGSAIDRAITDSNYDFHRYDLKTAAGMVMGEYGVERVGWVLASYINSHANDRRYSTDVKSWAAGFTTPERQYTFQSHPVVLDGFAGIIRKEERQLFLERLEKTAQYIIDISTQNTLSGNYIVWADNIPPEILPSGMFDKHINEIAEIIEGHEAVADVQLPYDGSIDVVYHLAYCKNHEMYEGLLPDMEIDDMGTHGADAGIDGTESSLEHDLLHGSDHDGLFGIYQIPAGNDGLRKHRFANMREHEHDGLKVERANYNLVHVGQMTDSDILYNLNKIYSDFNGDHPEGYTGRSVSVSDVIVLQWKGGVSAHFVDGIGLKKLVEFTGKESKPEVARANQAKSANTKPSILDLLERHKQTASQQDQQRPAAGQKKSDIEV
jgi:hypothetical protein